LQLALASAGSATYVNRRRRVDVDQAGQQ